ncbi:MAG TPA: hypothetical protein IAB65_06340 [Candidatus Onthocola stercorigallinarum]|nr:hypothetical protein [Candidatus Onthocola stercorigallinarum]
MILEKKLSIKEIFDEMKVIRSRLIELSHKYNRTLINISAVTWKDVVTKGGMKGDIMLNRVIKKENLENEFDVVMETYKDYKEMAINEIREMMRNNSVEYCIVYFRDNLRWKWNDISKLFNYSIKQCHRLYNKEKRRNVS